MAQGQGKLIAVGASTGGTEALARLFKSLPRPVPGIVVVQHMPPGFTQMYAERLDRELPFRVREAAGNEEIKENEIYIAPGSRQMRVVKVDGAYFTRLGESEKHSGHCPSVDVLFESAAKAAGSGGIGVILTGMGADGAEGLLSMRRAGALTLGQDEESCVVYGMPKKAFDLGAVMRQGDPEKLAVYIGRGLL